MSFILPGKIVVMIRIGKLFKWAGSFIGELASVKRGKRILTINLNGEIVDPDKKPL